MPKCRVCKVEKPDDGFYRRSENGRLRRECRICMIDRHTCRNRGLSFQDLLRLEREADGKCQSCGGPQTATRLTRLSVDHDHRTGAVRGLLCHKCNTAIGLMDDDPMKLEQAASYLRKHGQTLTPVINV